MYNKYLLWLGTTDIQRIILLANDSNTNCHGLVLVNIRDSLLKDVVDKIHRELLPASVLQHRCSRLVLCF